VTLVVPFEITTEKPYVPDSLTVQTDDYALLSPLSLNDVVAPLGALVTDQV
jgi:hypothetical protein